MPLKKSELYSSIWASCDELRGGMDASQYKDYVLVLLFVKYVSDKYVGQKNSLIEVPKGGSFADMVALKGQKDIGDGMNRIISRLAEANDLKGVVDVADFNDADKLGEGKEMQDRLSNLVAIFEDPALDFSKNRADADELIGDVFEYLINNFASLSSRIGNGAFLTPSEISELLAKLVESKSGERIYDPACGSGLLLVKCAEQANNPKSCLLYGQEIDRSTRALAIMNFWFQDLKSVIIECGDTLRNPLLIEKDHLMNFDVVVSNPPFALKHWGYEEWRNDKFGRNVAGLPPEKCGDFAWILHVVSSMKSETGRAAIVVPHGVLFRGGAEETLRKYLIENDVLEAIISLGPNLMYSTGVPVTILTFRTRKVSNRCKRVLFINASTLFESKGTKNNISASNISQIISWYRNFEDVPGLVRVMPINKLGETGWNLNVPHYIKPEPGKLLENAIVSIRLGLDDFEMGTDERIISSIRNLYAGMLLLFKEKLLRLSPNESDEVLIKSEVSPVKENGKIKFKGVGRKTVEVSQIKKRFENLGVHVDWKRVDAIQNKRNDIEHYFTFEKKDAIREAISSAFIVVSDFITDELNDNPRELLGANYWNIMLKTSELYEAQRKNCLSSLQKIDWQSTTISKLVDEIRCPSCNSSLITPGENIASKIENQYFSCRSCGQSTSYRDLVESLTNDLHQVTLNTDEIGDQ